MASCGQLTIIDPFDSGAVSAADCVGLPSEAEPGATVEATVTVTNGNADAASATVEVTAGGQVLGTTTVTIQGNTQRQVTVEIDTSGLSTGTTHDVTATATGASQASAARADGGTTARPSGITRLDRRTQTCSTCGGP